MFKQSIILLLTTCVILTQCKSINWDLSDCKAGCKSGSSLSPIIGTSPSFNGCGSYDVKVNFTKYDNLSGFNSCCNNHDICYNTCSSTKSACDSTLYSCLNAAVSASNAKFLKKAEYYAIALGMFGTVKLFGCPAYVFAMRATCNCP